MAPYHYLDLFHSQRTNHMLHSIHCYQCHTVNVQDQYNNGVKAVALIPSEVHPILNINNMNTLS